MATPVSTAATVATVAEALEGPPVLGVVGDDARLTDDLLAPLWKFDRGWQMLMGLTGLGVLGLVIAIYYTITTGIGVWGNNIPIGWAFDITNFVWWIGIGHAGTFISAILLLLEQRWRTSINRFAEAMTLFAVLNAAVFPVLHLGRPWFAYWLAPYPNTMNVWPNFKSALTWDLAAISTYGLTSLIFWYIGLVPDLAAARDRTTGGKRTIYAIFALGWRGSARHWRHYRVVYGLLAGLAAPLVISVHSTVSMDFASGIVPGWHSTIFPPYFVAGAIFSGFAMVLTLLVPCRRIFKLEAVVTVRHLDNMSKLLLVTGWIVAYAYLLEQFLAWYSGDIFEVQMFFRDRPFGPYPGLFFLMIFCNVIVPQVFWSQRARHSEFIIFVVSILINVGMWLERFVIIAGSLSRDYLPSIWADYRPTWVDWTLLFGTISFFLFLFLIFLKLVPFIPMTELKEMRAEMRHEHVEPLR